MRMLAHMCMHDPVQGGCRQPGEVPSPPVATSPMELGSPDVHAEYDPTTNRKKVG